MLTVTAADWLKSFLSAPERADGVPDGRPLYAYQARASDYRSLIECLREPRVPNSPLPTSRHWAACFCLFVSEFYRREYEGGTGGWTWAAPEGALGIELDPQQRGELVQRGLVGYWRRPVRTGESGRRFLGSLYAEGGLPWKLVQKEEHGFGRAIRGGLTRHDELVSLGRSLVAHMERYSPYLPKGFQVTDTYEKLAAIVAELMRVAGAHPTLPSEPDEAVALLDRESPGWRTRFPIPLDEANGRRLIATWLTDAANERASSWDDRSGDLLVSETFLGGNTGWELRTVVTFPEQLDLDLDGEALTSTRLTLSLFEGKEELAALASVYAEVDEDFSHASARFRQRHCEVFRKAVREPLTVRAFSHGRLVGTLLVASPAEDGDDLPLIFEPVDEDDWRWIGCTSTSVDHDVLRIFVPAGAELTGSPRYDVLDPGDESAGRIAGQAGTWMKLHDSATIESSAGVVRLRLNASDGAARPTLVGIVDSRDTLPRFAYRGFPSLVPPVDSDRRPVDYVAKLDGRAVAISTLDAFVGTARLAISLPEEGLLLSRRFGVLPRQLRVALQPGLGAVPTCLEIRTTRGVRVGIKEEGLKSILVAKGDVCRFELHLTEATAPQFVLIYLASDDDIEPVVVRVPFPSHPAVLMGPDSSSTDITNLSIDDLLGTRLVLSSDGAGRQSSHLSFTLEGRAGRKLELHQEIEVGETPVALALHACREDWMRMLAARPDQDDYIRVRVESDRLLKGFAVRRFDARLRREHGEGDDVIALQGFDGRPPAGSVALQAMDVTSPESGRVPVDERLSGIVGTGLFQLPEATRHGGPWLVFADETSPITVRPYFVRSRETAPCVEPASPLHEACARFDHTANPTAIDDVIAIMAGDFDHAGWAYLKCLRKDYDRLPLSSFEAWRSVAKSPRALVGALMKLEPDTGFTERFANELAVLWEEVPLRYWNDGLQMLRTTIETQLGSTDLADTVVVSRLSMLVEAIPGFRNLVDLQSRSIGLRPGNEVVYEHTLGRWYEDLLRRHANNRRWPDRLREPLEYWFSTQEGLPRPQAFDGEFPGFVRGVCLLPLFMASVTTGRASLVELDADREAARFDMRTLSDFDRSWYEPVYAQALALLIAGEA